MFIVILVSLFCFVGIIKVSAFTVKDSAQVEDYILYMASHEGVSVNLALGIANAESGTWHDKLKRKLPNPTAKNPVGTASGSFQYLDSTFKGFCINTFGMTDTMNDKNHAAIQVNCAVEMLKMPLGYKHWCASYENWIKSIPLEEQKLYNCVNA